MWYEYSVSGTLVSSIASHPAQLFYDVVGFKCIFPSSDLLRGVSRFETDVSVLPVDPIIKGKNIRLDILPLENGTIRPETSISNRLAPRNNPEDERIQLFYLNSSNYLHQLRISSLASCRSVHRIWFENPQGQFD